MLLQLEYKTEDGISQIFNPTYDLLKKEPSDITLYYKHSIVCNTLFEYYITKYKDIVYTIVLENVYDAKNISQFSNLKTIILNECELVSIDLDSIQQLTIKNMTTNNNNLINCDSVDIINVKGIINVANIVNLVVCFSELNILQVINRSDRIIINSSKIINMLIENGEVYLCENSRIKYLTIVGTESVFVYYNPMTTNKITLHIKNQIKSLKVHNALVLYNKSVHNFIKVAKEVYLQICCNKKIYIVKDQETKNLFLDEFGR